MKRIAMILCLFVLVLAGCASSSPSPDRPHPRRPHPGAVWIPGHHAPNGAWIAGHWR
jgi:hypothetical protein